MDDLEIVARIGELTDEEHALERAHSGKALSEDDLERLRTLRQRRARRDAGEDPSEAAARPEGVVEGYQQ